MPLPSILPSDFLSCDEKIPASSTPFTSEGKREYARVFQVITSKKNIGPNTVLYAPNLPKIYSSYQSWDGKESDLLSVLVRYTASKPTEDEWLHWEVTAHYSTEVPEGGIPEYTSVGADPNGAQNAPWYERPVIEWDWEETTHAPPRDLDGKAYLNSAGMPFSPPPQFPAARNILKVTRNEPTYSQSIAAQWAYAVNADTFLGAAPGTVLLRPPRVKTRNRGPLQYYTISYSLVFNLPKLPDPPPGTPPVNNPNVPNAVAALQSWQPEILDQGTHQLQKIAGVPFTGRPVPIMRYGSPTSKEVLLDGLGVELKRNGAGVFVPVYIKYRNYHSQNFRTIIERGIFGGI